MHYVSLSFVAIRYAILISIFDTERFYYSIYLP